MEAFNTRAEAVGSEHTRVEFQWEGVICLKMSDFEGRMAEVASR